jgi:hypothetical protein
MGSRYIELFPYNTQQPDASGRTRTAAANGAVAQSLYAATPLAMAGVAQPVVAGPGSASLKMRGLPYGATIDDICTFFAGYGILRETISIGPPGQASVRFTSVQEAARAYAERNQQYIGQRYIELFGQ